MARPGYEGAAALCQALGIDPNQVQRVELVADAKNVLRVTITMMPDVTPEAFKAIGDALVADDKVVELVISRPVVEAVRLDATRRDGGFVEYVT